MTKPLLPIKDFPRGMIPNATDGIAMATMYCLDPHTRPGVLRVNPRLDADSDTAVTRSIRWMAAYEPSGGARELYAYDNKTAGSQIYRRTSGSWALVRTNTASSDGQGLAAFGASLYYTSRSSLGKLTGDPTVGGNYNDTFQSLAATVESTDVCPLKVFAGSLYVGNGRYVGRLESGEVIWDGDYLTLPSGVVVMALEVWNDRLIISTRGATKGEQSYIYIWDGISDFPELAIPVPAPGASALANKDNVLRAFIGSGIYRFNGSEFNLEYVLPKTSDGSSIDAVKVYPGSVELWNNQLLFAVSQAAGVKNTSLNGIWSLGSHSAKTPEALTFAFEISTGENSEIEIGAIKTFGATNDTPILYAGWYDFSGAGAYGVDVINYDRRYTSSAYFLTDAFDVTRGEQFGRLLQGVACEFAVDMNTTAADNKLVIKYRTDKDIDPEDDTANFTTLGTIDNDSSGNNNQNEILYGIYQRVKRIQFRVEFTCDADSNQGPELISFNAY